mmetsp:Transcript_96811/g.270984  ORF Transcript_96811/g.270984 Transcript_96811/m.270984 type:complete len:956 (-) Transcript_96811:2-2869(-)
MPRVERHVVDRAHDEAGLARELREVADRQADGRLVDVEVELEDRGERGGVHDPDARAPLALARLEGAHLALRQVLLLVVLVLHIVELVVRRPGQADLLQRRSDLALRLLVVGVVIRLEERQHDGVARAMARGGQRRRRQRHEAARRVGERHHGLVEEVAEALARDDPQRVPRDGDKTLGALLGREGRRELQLLVAHRRAMVLPLEVVAQPRLRAKREHPRHALHAHPVQAHGLGPEEAGALVAERARHEVDHGADEDAAAQPDAEEEAVHVLTLPQVLHLRQAHALSGGLQCLRTELLQRPLPLQRQDADGVVHAADRHEGRALPVLRHGLHGEAEDLVVHVSLRHLVQRVALVDLEVQDLAAGERDHHLALVRRGGDDTLLPGHAPLVSAAGQQVPDARGVDLHVRVVRHQLDQQRRRGGQEAAVQNLLDGVADGEHEGHVDEGHDDVSVKLAVHRGLDGPDGVRLPRQLADGHLRHGEAVAEHAHRGAGAAAAEGVELRPALACGVQHLHVDDRRQRRHLVVQHEVLQGARLEGHQRLRSVGMRRGAERILLVRTDALELIQGVVAELGGREEEARLQHAEGVGQGDGVEVLHLNLGHQVLVVRQRDLVEVAVLALDEEEEEVLQLVRGVCDDQQPLLLRHLEPARDGAHDVGVALLLVDEAILAADEHAARPVDAAGHGDEGVRAVVHGVGELPRHVVEAEVHLVQREHLLRRVGVRVTVDLFVAELDRGEQRVLEADVHAARGVHQRVALVRLQGRGDGEPRRGVAVQDVDELLLLDGANHHGAALGVDGQVLAGHDPSAARLAVGLHVHLLENVLRPVVLEDHDPAGVGRDHDVVPAGARQAERLDVPHHTEDVLREDALHLAAVVGSQQLEGLVARDDNLLRLWGGEVAIDGLRDRRRALQGEVVELRHPAPPTRPPRGPRLEARARPWSPVVGGRRADVPGVGREGAA